MAITERAAGTWVASNATTQVVSIPVGSTSGDMMLMHFGAKPWDTSVSINQGWTVLAQGVDGAVANGNGTGSVRGGVAYKIHTGSESNPTITWGATSAPGIAVIITFQKAAGDTWGTPVTILGAVNNSTSVNVTMPSNPGVTAGDLVVYGIYTRDNAAITLLTCTQSGVTYTGSAEFPQTAIATTTSNDMSGDSAYKLASSGTASAAPVILATQATAETGVLSFTRVRVSTGTNAAGGNAAGTGAASNALGRVASAAGHVSATAAAAAATVLTVSGPQAATATAAAHNATAIAFSISDTTDATLGKLQLGTARLGDVIDTTSTPAAAGIAAATGAASTAAIELGVPVENAAATLAAGDASVNKVDGIEATSATATAYDSGRILVICFSSAGAATAAAHDTALIRVAVNAGHASATVAAGGVVLGAGAQSIVATAAVYDALGALGVQAEHAAATGIARTASVNAAAQTNAQPSAIAITAAAADMSVSLSANAEAAAAIAAAFDATPAYRIDAGAAEGVGTSYDAEVGQFEIEANAGHVSATGSAYDAAIAVMLPGHFAGVVHASASSFSGSGRVPVLSGRS